MFSILGFIYSSFFYNEFGIYYLNHAELTDLFGVLFIHPLFFFSLLMFISSFFVFGTFDELEEKTTIKYENIWLIGKLYNNRFIILSIACFVSMVFFSYWVVDDKIAKIKSFKLPIQQVTYNKSSTLKCVVNIGSTSTSLFYWDINSLESVIIPKSKIIKISIIIPEVPHKGRPQKPPIDGSKTEYQKALLKWNSDIERKCK